MNTPSSLHMGVTAGNNSKANHFMTPDDSIRILQNHILPIRTER